MNNLSGVINIYKEKGYTSHDVVNIVRKKLNRIKTGHTGTLDPDATGVLPICIGKATKISDYIASDIKEYTAKLILGITTDTLDLSGNIISEKKVDLTKDEITNAINLFIGDIYQTPPMYSAIKIKGEKLYNLARKGIEVERKKRLVKIYDIKYDFISEKEVILNITCSKGTYIRSLCNDIGEKLNCGGVMGELVRNRTGRFYLKDAVKLDEFDKIVSENRLNDILIPIDNVISFKKYYVKQEADKYLLNGNKISLNYVDKNKSLENEEKILIYDFRSNLIGIYVVNKIENFIKPITMLF